MNKFFIALYDFFESRRTLLYALLGVLVVAMASAALRLRFSENITGFFPDGERKAAAAFSNLKIKDKIAVMINAGEDAADKTDEMMACADSLAARLNADTLFRRYAEVEATFGSELADGMRSFLQGNLPLLLSEADYARMDTLVTPRGIAQAMEGNYRRLLSPVGGFIDEYIYDDALGLSFGALGKLQELNIGGNYTLCDDYLFSKGMTTLLVFISPNYQSGDTGVGDRLIERIESALEELNAEYAAAGITADYYGGPAVAAYNARQIKRDMMLTLNIAILIIVTFITLSFRNKFAVLLALIPVALGALFALALMSLTCHTISSIAVGAGTVVMGIALSYSIHILCHANHCHDPRQIIRDLAYPLTIGSITTIGAFAGLLFTDSQLLRDFGLFASLTLVGTTLFSLVLLPHLIRKEKRGGGSAVLERVERLTGMRPDRNRPLVAAILLLTFICLFFFNRIGFDKGLVSADEYDKIAQAYRQAEEELAAAEDNLQVVRDGVSKSNASASSTLVRSTITGVILDIPVKVGNSVILSNTFNDGTTIASVADMNDLIFRGNIDETEVGRLVTGMPMKLSVGALQDTKFDASLEYISPKAVDNNGANQFEIKAAVKVTGGKNIRSGYSANAEIVLAQARNVLTIPESAIEFEGEDTYVYIVKGEGDEKTYERRKVTTGLSDGINIEIKKGLTQKDRVRGPKIITDDKKEQ